MLDATGAPLTPPAIGRRTLLGAAVLVFVAAVAVYLNAVPNGFALDDVPIIEENPTVTEGASYGEIWTGRYWPDRPREMALYRPLSVSMYRLEWDLWNGDPRGFHAVNIVLHGAASVLVLLLLVSVGAPVAGAAAGALIFGVHPVHVEAVANVVGRAEIIATLSVVGGVLLHRGIRHRWLRRGAVAGVFFLGLAAKESAVALPALLLLTDVLVPVEETAGAAVRARLAGYLALALPLAGYLALRFAVLGVGTGTDPYPALTGAPEGTRLLTAIATLPEHVRLMLWPADLVSDYGPATLLLQTGFTPDVALGLVVAAAFCLAVVSTWRRGWAVPALGLVWYAVSAFPVSNLAVPVGVMLAERTLYLPSVGAAMVASALVGAALRTREPAALRPATVGLVAAAVVLASVRTVTRNPTWASTDRVVRTLVEEHPEHYQAFAWRGDRFRDLGELDRAIASYETALELAPGHNRVALRLAFYFSLAGRWRDVVDVVETYITRRWQPYHVFRVQGYTQLGLLDEAEAALADARAFLDAQPRIFGDSSVYYDLKGQLLIVRGDSAAAETAFRRAEAIRGPDGTRLIRGLSQLPEPGGAAATPGDSTPGGPSR